MKYVLCVFIAFFVNTAHAGIDAIGELIRGLEEKEIVTYTVETYKGGSASGAAVAQFVWNEIKTAQSDVSTALSDLSTRLSNLQSRLDRHIYKDRREHADLQKQIHALQREMQLLKAKSTTNKE